MTFLRNDPPFQRCTLSRNLVTRRSGSFGQVAGLVVTKQRPATASGVLFITLEDEAGDLLGPLARGVIREADIEGDLFQLCRGKVAGRGGPDEITLFKSAGTAVEDLAAAVLVWRRVERPVDKV